MFDQRQTHIFTYCTNRRRQ